jgi:GNAT superfamily N-acetyltransferase
MKQLNMNGIKSMEKAIPAGTIRVYNHQKDYKYLKFLIGSAILSRTAAANQKLFWGNPLVYLWTTLFTLYIALQHFRLPQQELDHASQPASQHLSIISAILIRLPFLFAPPLILLVLLNRANRSYFHSLLVHTLAHPDLRDPVSHYLNPTQTDDQKREEEEAEVKSRIWVLDYDGRQLGVLALDVNMDGYEQLLGSATRTVFVRHLACAPDFRPAGIDQELLEHVCRRVFRHGSSVTRIALRTHLPSDPFLQSALNNLRFRPLLSAPNLTAVSNTHTFGNTLLSYLGFPNCHLIWKEQLFILDRPSSTPPSEETEKKKYHPQTLKANFRE